MYVIAVNKSQEFLLNVRQIFRLRRRRLHVDASRRNEFDFDDESMFFRRRRTLSARRVFVEDEA